MTKEINELTSKPLAVGTDEIAIQETGGGATKKTTLADITINGKTYQYSSTAASNSHSGISTGYLIQGTYFDNNDIVGSGGSYAYTGTTTAAKAGNWPDSDGYFYDTDGKQFEIVGAIVSVQQFGAVGDDSTDDSGAIQKAITAAETAGGGIILLPEATYAVASTLTVDDDGVMLIGMGPCNAAAGGKAAIRASAATTLKWTGSSGSGPIIKYTSDSADSGTEVMKSGGGLEGVFLDGQESASICFELQSWQRGTFRNIHAGWARTYGYKIWTLTNGVSAGSDDNQHNIFQNVAYSEVNTGQNPVGMIVGCGNSSNGNTSMQSWLDLRILMDGSGNGLELENTDTNFFYHVRVGHRTGGGTAKIVLHADDTGTLSNDTTCRYNQFFALEAGDGLTAKKTAAGSTNSHSNIVFGYSRGNSAPAPTIEDGADLQYWQSTELTAVAAQLYKFDSGATSGPILRLTRDSASPAGSDVIGQIEIEGRDSGDNLTDYVRLSTTIVTTTDTSEDAKFSITPIIGGSLVTNIEVQNGVRMGSPTGGFKGNGTLNAVEVYDDNSLLT